MNINRHPRTAAATALIYSLALITFAPGRVTMARQTPTPANASAGKNLSAPATRFALIDTEILAEQGVILEGNATTVARLEAFSSRLNVQIIDVARLRGIVFIGDESLDLTDSFVAAVRAKSSRSGQTVVPAVKIPDARVAFVNTDGFNDPAAGITRLAEVFAAVEREFKPRREEIDQLRGQAAAASGETKKKLESEVAKKTVAGQAALDKRVEEMTAPIYEDIGRALSRFCKRHGISLIFDASKFNVTDKLPPYGLTLPPETPDLSTAFISEYNRGVLKP